MSRPPLPMAKPAPVPSCPLSEHSAEKLLMRFTLSTGERPKARSPRAAPWSLYRLIWPCSSMSSPKSPTSRLKFVGFAASSTRARLRRTSWTSFFHARVLRRRLAMSPSARRGKSLRTLGPPRKITGGLLSNLRSLRLRNEGRRECC